jgi:hypothetical protein
MKQKVKPEFPDEKNPDPGQIEENGDQARSGKPRRETARCDCPPGCVGLPCCTGAA